MTSCALQIAGARAEIESGCSADKIAVIQVLYRVIVFPTRALTFVNLTLPLDVPRGLDFLARPLVVRVYVSPRNIDYHIRAGS